MNFHSSNSLVPKINLISKSNNESANLSVYNQNLQPLPRSDSSLTALNSSVIRSSSNSCYALNNLENSNITQIKNNENLFANLKNAFMLFVVTIIMAIVYTPAILTSLGIIRYNPIHWNLIYINNAANPIVYSFMNKKFRMSLRKKLKSF